MIVTRNSIGIRNTHGIAGRCWHWSRVGGLLIVLVSTCARAQEKPAVGEMDHLVQVLQSQSTYSQKMLACKRLARIGTGRVVPALATLLTDKDLSHGARIALEAIPGPEAAAALRDAVAQVDGELLIGVINSIGARHDARAVGILRPKLVGPNPRIAAAAAAALGKISGDAARDALLDALKNARPTARGALGDACLQCAEACVAAGNRAGAAAIYTRLCDAQLPARIAPAARRGAILTGPPDEATRRLAAELESEETSRFAMALDVCRALPGGDVTRILVRKLDHFKPERQALVLSLLGDRADPTARPAVTRYLASLHSTVRIAAIRALATLGDKDSIQDLLAMADQNDADTTAAVLDCLTSMQQSDVDQALTGSLDKAQGPVRLLLIQVVGRRRIRSAVPRLLKSVRDGAAAVRAAAIRSLGETIDASRIKALVDVLKQPGPAQVNHAVHDALRVASARLAGDATCARVLANALQSGTPDERSFLLSLLALVGGPTALHAVADAAFDPRADMQDAATRLLGQWRGADAAPVLLKVAQEGSSEKFRIRALRGYIRIVRQFDVPDDQRVAMCRDAMRLATRKDEQRLVLEALGRVPSATALAMVVPSLDVPALARAASAAAVAIGERIVGPENKTVAQAMRRVLRVAKDPELVRRARDVLRKTEPESASGSG